MAQSKIYIGNLSYSVGKEDLQDFFGKFGEITDLRLITDRETGRSKGFAFITFELADNAEQAVNEGNGVELLGRQMRVNIAKDDDCGRRGGSAGGRAR